MEYSELDVELELLKNYKALLGLPETSSIARQVRLGNYGTADLVIWDREPRAMWLVEIKKGSCKPRDIAQGARYMVALDRSVLGSPNDWQINCILATAKIDCADTNNDACFLYRHLHRFRFWEYTVTMEDGLSGGYDDKEWKRGDGSWGRELAGLIDYSVSFGKDEECPRDE